MFGMKALPYVGELAQKVEQINLSAKVLPLVAPISAAQYVTNNINQVAQKIDRVMQFVRLVMSEIRQDT